MLRMHSTVLQSHGLKLAQTFVWRMVCLNVSQLSFEWQEVMLERIQEVTIELGNQLCLGLVL
jgi:hypothetical protein